VARRAAGGSSQGGARRWRWRLLLTWFLGSRAGFGLTTWMQTTGEREDWDDSGSWIVVSAIGHASDRAPLLLYGPGLGQDHRTPGHTVGTFACWMLRYALAAM
jgi:hypothetical protein